MKVIENLNVNTDRNEPSSQTLGCVNKSEIHLDELYELCDSEKERLVKHVKLKII